MNPTQFQQWQKASIDTAAEIILSNWEEWSGEAGQAAQVEQDPEAGESVMLEHIRTVLRVSFIATLREGERLREENERLRNRENARVRGHRLTIDESRMIDQEARINERLGAKPESQPPSPKE